MNKREQNIRFEILGLILSYEVSKGHLKWKVTDVSRRLKVSRSLIYYHFGNKKEDILDSCYKMVAEAFYALGNDFRKLADFENRVLEKALRRTQDIYLHTPAIVTFFHRWRLENSPVQDRILEIEKKYQAQLQDAFPHLSGDEILALHMVMHGVVTAPFANPASVRIVTTLLKPFLAKKSC